MIKRDNNTIERIKRVGVGIVKSVAGVLICAALFFGGVSNTHAESAHDLYAGANITTNSSGGGSDLFKTRYLPDIIKGANGPADMIFFLYKYLMGLVGIIAVGVIMYAGVLYTVSADGGKIKASHELIKNALKGIVLLFGAQVLFNTINPNIVDFPRIQKAIQPKAKFTPTAFTGVEIASPTSTVESAQGAVNLYGGAHPACVSGTTNGVKNVYPDCGPNGVVDLATKIQPCNDCMLAGQSTNPGFYTSASACFGYERGGCYVNKALADTLKKLTDSTRTVGTQWLVTGGYPPGANHSDPCHWDGTCVDIAFTGKTATSANVDGFIAAAQSAGLKVVNEYGTGTLVKPKTFSTTTGGHLHVHL